MDLRGLSYSLEPLALLRPTSTTQQENHRCNHSSSDSCRDTPLASNEQLRSSCHVHLPRIPKRFEWNHYTKETHSRKQSCFPRGRLRLDHSRTLDDTPYVRSLTNHKGRVRLN